MEFKYNLYLTFQIDETGEVLYWGHFRNFVLNTPAVEGRSLRLYITENFDLVSRITDVKYTARMIIGGFDQQTTEIYTNPIGIDSSKTDLVRKMLDRTGFFYGYKKQKSSD
jgi:hypothetical protein